MKSFLTLAATLSALSVSACASFAAGPHSLGREVRQDGFARIGQPTRVGALLVTPLRIVEDSRCPMNARCIWAGRLVVATRLEAGGRANTTNMELGRPYIAYDRGIQLSSAQPDKMAGRETAQRDYLFGYTGG